MFFPYLLLFHPCPTFPFNSFFRLSCPNSWRHRLDFSQPSVQCFYPWCELMSSYEKKTFELFKSSYSDSRQLSRMFSPKQKTIALCTSHQRNKHHRESPVDGCLDCWEEAWPPQFQTSLVLRCPAAFLPPDWTIHSRFIQGKKYLIDSCLMVALLEHMSQFWGQTCCELRVSA